MDTRRKKFCLVSQYWSPDIVGDATRVQQIVEGLKKLNCDVTVVTTQPHYPRGDRRGMKFRWMSASYEGQVLVFRLGMPTLSHSGVGNRFLLYSWFAVGSFLPSVVLGRGSTHWAFSQRVFSSYPAMLLRFFFRRKVISDVTDVWPEAVVNTGLIAPDSTVFKVGRGAAKVAYLTSSRITTMTEKMRSFLAAKYGISPEKVSIVPYGGRRLNVIDPPSSERFTVLYFGNLGPAYDFDVLVRAASQMSDVSFVIRGDGEDLGRLQKQKQDRDLANLTFLPAPLSDVELSSLVSGANVLVLPIKRQVYPDVSFPGKLIEYIQSGRPTILVGEGHPAELVERYQVGVTVSPGDFKGLAGAIRKLKEDPSLAHRLSANAKNIGTDLGEKALNDSLLQLLDKVG